MKLERGSIYIGKINKEPVYYLGLWHYDGEGAPVLHQFEYVVQRKFSSGYGQTTEQAQAENYRLDHTRTVLYGRKDV